MLTCAQDPYFEGLDNYMYDELLSDSSFRILELLPGEFDEPVSFRCHGADWNDPRPYEAVSYAWGDPNEKVKTICDGQILEVTPNLRDGLQYLRHRNHSRFLWADAVSIDQSNTKERGHQVNNMRKIYQNAQNVVIWLGTDDVNTAEPIALRDLVWKPGP